MVLTTDNLVGGHYSQGWSATDATGEDTVSAAGWRIADGHLLRPSNGVINGNWGTRAGGVPLRIAIRGTALDGTPSTPTLSVGQEGSRTEGDDMAFVVTLAEADEEDDVTATWTASIESGDTAVAADLGSTRTGPLTIVTGATTTRFMVPTVQDTTDEHDETFTVTLSGVSSNVELVSDPTATGIIVDDDDPPTLSVADVSTPEASLAAFFVVTLSAESGKTVTVTMTASAESGDTAESPADFSEFAVGLTFNPGVLTVGQAVVLADDSIVEDDETFTVTLSNATNAAISDATATGTITNDDTAASTCTLNTGDLWCGVVTPGTISSPGGPIAYGFTNTTGALSDTALPVGMNDYTIDGVWTGLGTDAGDLDLQSDQRRSPMTTGQNWCCISTASSEHVRVQRMRIGPNAFLPLPNGIAIRPGLDVGRPKSRCGCARRQRPRTRRPTSPRQWATRR